jgi:hypothetical protein
MTSLTTAVVCFALRLPLTLKERRRESVSPSTTPTKVSPSTIAQYKLQFKQLQLREEQEKRQAMEVIDSSPDHSNESPRGGEQQLGKDKEKETDKRQNTSLASPSADVGSLNRDSSERKSEGVPGVRALSSPVDAGVGRASLSVPIEEVTQVQGLSLGSASPPVKVPLYIIEFARDLLIEQNLSLEQVKESLANEGHSERIVDAVVESLQKEAGEVGFR